MSSNNPCSEALLRTCKYRPDWPKGFCNQAQAQSWVKRSADWYNSEPLIAWSASSHPMPATPAGREQENLNKRSLLYAKARASNQLL